MLKFAKYHGCGNDFIIIEKDEALDYQKVAKALCNRKIGIGADGLLVISMKPWSVQIFNADGSLATMCGNGLRCVGAYLDDKYHLKNRLVIKVSDKLVPLTFLEKKPYLVSLNMGRPSFMDPFKVVKSAYKQPLHFKIDNHDFDVYYTHVGTNNAVVFLDEGSFKDIDSSKIGEIIAHHPCFNTSVNVNFVFIKKANACEVKTYERGVGFSDACGSGCCSVYVIGRLLKLFDQVVSFDLKYGQLIVHSKQEIKETTMWYKPIYLIGGANKVYEGIIEIIK